MPVIVDPNSGALRQVSESAFKQQLENVAEERGRAVMRYHRDGPTKVRLVDLVDQSWTQPLPPEQIATYLRMVVIKCSACRYFTSFKGGVRQHVKNIEEAGVQHRDAKLELYVANGSSGQRCTGCGATFSSRKSQGQRHLDTAMSAPGEHRFVEELTLKRYGMEPSGPVVLGKRPVKDAGTAETGPVSTQVQGSQPERPVRTERRHGRHRRRAT